MGILIRRRATWLVILVVALVWTLACASDEPVDTGPSAAEIESIVKSAVGEQLTAADVQNIVDASTGGQLTATDVRQIINESLAGQLTAADV